MWPFSKPKVVVPPAPAPKVLPKMTLKEYTCYPQAVRQPDGTRTATMYNVLGEGQLQVKGLPTKQAYKDWVKENQEQFRKLKENT